MKAHVSENGTSVVIMGYLDRPCPLHGKFTDGTTITRYMTSNGSNVVSLLVKSGQLINWSDYVFVSVGISSGYQTD